MTSDTDFAIYNKNGFYEIRSALKNREGNLSLARVLYGLLNYFPGLPLWRFSRENDIILALMREVKVTVHTWNAGEYLSLQNGIFLVGRDTLIPHSPRYFKTFVLPINYNPEATCSRFILFIHEITGGNIPLALNLQEQIGYIISNCMKATKAFFWVSDGSSGKSTLANIVEAIVGTENVSAVTLSDINTRFGLAPMFGKKLNLANESEVTGLFRTERLKLLCTNDKVAVDRKGMPALSVRLSIKLLFLTNNMPELITDTKYGLDRRLHITPFPVKFSGSQVDIDLTDKLLLELDGIVIWALEGLKRLKSNDYKFTYCESIEKAKQDFFKNANPILNFFAIYYTKTEPPDNTAILKSSIYVAYEEWATKNYKPRSSKAKFWETLAHYFENLGQPLIVEKRHPGLDYLLHYQLTDEYFPVDEVIEL
jgi:putative DNA primase/helicase